ncbi:hypothetical protein PDESU_02193 [Pontiella desulfatans]|uniref:PEP-CTERM protein-sorting domain-containing protein n=1 Tax=Pontiella desulfatans TaxID=2750659 RepID=A0A6C2U2M8_PONDE|nr:PEP-CTERM sorting domain-containing protein [Pontiella desulfatans]VGO13636.1 hypothetical protein PDESU_02193 [Pontiella desulfatans]
MMKQLTWFGFAALIFAASATAETVRFYDDEAGSDNLWTNVQNWEYKPAGSWTNYAQLPESDDSVIITYGDSVVIDAAGLAVANEIDLGKYGVHGSLTTTSDGTLTTTADIMMNGSIKKTGNSEIGDPTKLINYGTNTIGTILNLASGSNRVYNAGQFSANAISLATAAETDVGGGTMMASTALFTNDVTGVVDVTANFTMASGDNSVAVLQNQGDMNVGGDVETSIGTSRITNEGTLDAANMYLGAGANGTTFFANTADGTVTTTGAMKLSEGAGAAVTMLNQGDMNVGAGFETHIGTSRITNEGTLDAANMYLGAGANGTTFFTNTLDGVINVSGVQQFGNGAGSSVTFVNAGTNLVTGNIETMGNGSVTINNSGLMESTANNINIGADTVVNNSGTMTAKVDFNLSGGTVVNDGTISTVEGSATKPASVFNNGFAFENTANGVLDLGWQLNLDAGTFTNRGTVTTGKSIYMGATASGGELTVYNAKDATIDPGGSLIMGNKAGSATATLINEGDILAGATSGMQLNHGTQTIQNKADGYIQAGILKTAMQADSVSIISNEGEILVTRGDPFGYFTSVAGTTLVHNAASGTFTVRYDMTLSEQSTAFTSITNSGTMSVGGDLSLALLGKTELVMDAGTLTLGGALVMTNGGSGLIDLNSGLLDLGSLDMNLEDENVYANYSVLMSGGEIWVDGDVYDDWTDAIALGVFEYDGDDLDGELAVTFEDGHTKLYVIPEPATLGLILLSGAVLLIGRRIRR